MTRSATRPAMRALVLFSLVFLALPIGAAGPLGPPPCGSASVTAFATGQGVVENLLFDGRGNLFVTKGGDLWRFTSDGVGALYLAGIGGGLALGPDGALYAGVLNDAAQAAAHTHASSVARIDLATGAATTYAAGFDMANGLVFDGDGNLYVSDDVGDAIVRVRPGGAWTEWAHVYGANGMVVDDAARTLYAALTFDQRSPVVAISLDDPTQQRVVAAASFGALTLEPGIVPPSSPTAPLVPQGLDDMTRGSDGALYAAAQTGAGVLRIDPDSGAVCIVAGGMPTASSVRVAHGFGSYDSAFFVTTFDGHIWVVW